MKKTTCTSHGVKPGMCIVRGSTPCKYHRKDGSCSVECDLEGKESKVPRKSETEKFTFYQLMNGVKEL